MFYFWHEHAAGSSSFHKRNYQILVFIYCMSDVNIKCTCWKCAKSEYTCALSGRGIHNSRSNKYLMRIMLSNIRAWIVKFNLSSWLGTLVTLLCSTYLHHGVIIVIINDSYDFYLRNVTVTNYDDRFKYKHAIHPLKKNCDIRDTLLLHLF